MLTVLYFAWVRDMIGMAEESADPPAEVTTVGELAAWLAGRSDGHRAALADLTRIRAAVDQEFADPEAPIGAAREVAFFPPVTGG